LHTPALLALFDELLHGVETVNGNDTETVIDSIFGIPLLVSSYDGAGNLTSVTLLGNNITALSRVGASGRIGRTGPVRGPGRTTLVGSPSRGGKTVGDAVQGGPAS
jgi:YD repeat-containing protein